MTYVEDEPPIRLAPVRQRLHAAPIRDVPAAVRQAVAAAGLEGLVRPRQRIAITAGSRGIANIALILRTVGERLREFGAEPFLVPAMGSHGGATAEGQARLLRETFEIEERTAGMPVRSSMEVVELGPMPERGIPVYLDRHAAEADGIVIVNRVKPHTDYSGPFESGLMKMIAIGLGKRAQAESIHAHGARGLRELIPEIGRAKLARSPILAGIGIVEDGYDQTSEIRGMPAAAIEAEEPRLLELARRMLPRLPFPEVDLLVVDELGKEISGSGMDPNVIGRRRIEGEPDPEGTRCERIVVRCLSARTHGNAVGIGLADVITRRLYEGIDWEITNTNAFVSGFLMRGMVPAVEESDRAAIGLARYLLRRQSTDGLRVARIHDTLHLEQLHVSPALLTEANGSEALEVLGAPAPLTFDAAGNLA